MKVYKTKEGIVINNSDKFFLSTEANWDNLINRADLRKSLLEETGKAKQIGEGKWLENRELLVPIGTQEVWAAGVTYLRSKTARMEESKESGGASFYDKVYEAERPELFFKANAFKVVPTGGKVRIRKDSHWNVPEPELTLVINRSGKIIGYTIGNDMSSRSIEGENPLYLPQAKIYDGSASIGPCVLLTEGPIDPGTIISIRIERNSGIVFEGNTSISQMKRKHEELAEFLYRENSFPNGAYLMTGTCVVPGNEFTLQPGDGIYISIDGIGELVNHVE